MSAAPRRPAPRPTRAPAARSTFLWSAPAPAAGAWLPGATWAVVALFAAALIAMIAGPHRVGDVFTETDFYGAYGPGARALEQGHLDPTRYAVIGPVYELVLALVGFVVRDLFLAAELISVAAMTLALACWGRLLRARLGASAAWLAVLFLAVSGQWFRYGYSATTDALAVALQALALLLLFSGAAAPRRLALAGLVAGLAFLTRYSAVALLPAGLLAPWLDRERFARAGRARAALIFAAAFLAPVLPWLAISLLSGGHFAFQLHHNIAYDVFARSKGIPWDTYEREMQSQFPTPWSVVARDPGAVASRMVFNVFDHLRLDALKLAGVPLALAALLGPVFAWRDGSLARLAPLLVAGAWLFLALVPAFHSERYSLPLLPLWAALAAVTFTSPLLALSLDAGGGRRLWLKSVLAVVPLALTLSACVSTQRQQLRMLPVEVRDIVRMARPLLKPGDRVMARKAYFAWHAGLEPVPFPFADSLSQLAAAARAGHVRWLYFSWPEAEMRPMFAYLLDTTSQVPGLTVRAITREHPAVLYEIGPEFGRDPAWLGSEELRAVHRARAQVLISDNDWRARLLVGMYERSRGHYDAAAPFADAAARLAPEELATQLLLGDVLVHTGSPQGARTAFEHAARIDPTSPEARIGLGWAALEDGRAGEAAELWKPVVPVTDDAATLRRMLALFTAAGDAETRDEVRGRMSQLGVTP